MPITPKPGYMRTRCKQCSFTSTPMTRGDVVVLPAANKCPRCGSKSMELTPTADLLSTVKGWLGLGR